MKIIEAPLNLVDQEKKMDAWHAGTRNQNLNMSDEKLQINYDICVRKGYTKEAKILADIARDRQLSWAPAATNTTHGSIGQYVIDNTTSNDFTLENAQFIINNKDNEKAIVRNTFIDRHIPITEGFKLYLIYLIFAIVLGYKEIAEYLSEALNLKDKTSKEIVSAVIKKPGVKEAVSKVINELQDKKTESLDKIDEDIEKHAELNPKLWENNKLKPEVREKIVTIVEEFINGLKDNEIKFNLKDIRLVGSNCSYNYTKDSDLDIHLIMETKSLKCPDNLYPLLYSAYRSIFNNKFDIEFYGIPVELFVETEDLENSDPNVDPMVEAIDKETIMSMRKRLIDDTGTRPFIDSTGFFKITGLSDSEVKKISSILNKLDYVKDVKVSLGNISSNKGYGYSERNYYINGYLIPEKLNESMQDKVIKTTNNFKKEHGQIICNKGEQEKEVTDLLKQYYKKIDIIPGKGGSVNIKYSLTEAFQQAPLKSNGIYSVMFDKWVKEPIAADIPDIDKEAFEKELKVWEDEAKGLLDDSKEKLDENILKEDNEFGRYKDAFIRSILQQNATALHKGAETRKIYNKHTGQMEDTFLWDSVLHHIDGNHENNPFDFSNYALIQCADYSTAMLVHRLIHLLSYAENGNAAEELKDKIKSYDPEFITISDDNKLEINDFESWWNKTGKLILNSVSEKIANMQPGKKIVLESKETDILKARSIIADQIRGEWDADKGYTKAAADLAELKDVDTKEAQDMMLDIASEEHVHVGELETAYSAFDPKLFDELEDGHNEADEKAEPANDLDYDTSEEPVAESLAESVESEKIEKIDTFIEKVYELRKTSIAEDGEYGIGNLLFKELRNKGYLDDLREIKFKLKSKELSLESLKETKNNNKEVLPSVLKDISIIDVTAKSPLWTIVVSPDFLKMYNSLTKTDRAKTNELLNRIIPIIKIDGHWPVNTDPLKGHHYPIIELKIGTNKTGQPIRILYFTKHINNIRYMIFGAILVHTEPNLSKQERELCDKSYEIFLK